MADADFFRVQLLPSFVDTATWNPSCGIACTSATMSATRSTTAGAASAGRPDLSRSGGQPSSVELILHASSETEDAPCAVWNALFRAGARRGRRLLLSARRRRRPRDPRLGAHFRPPLPAQPRPARSRRHRADGPHIAPGSGRSRSRSSPVSTWTSSGRITRQYSRIGGATTGSADVYAPHLRRWTSHVAHNRGGEQRYRIDYAGAAARGRGCPRPRPRCEVSNT